MEELRLGGIPRAQTDGGTLVSIRLTRSVASTHFVAGSEGVGCPCVSCLSKEATLRSRRPLAAAVLAHCPCRLFFVRSDGDD
jgi:hypothetical protein